MGKPTNVGAQNSTGQTQNHLTDVKLRACQARENAIKKRASHLNQLATNIESNFDKHAQRVEEYYTSKVVPSGKTVANYDSLVADIDAKKAALDAAKAAEAQKKVHGTLDTLAGLAAGAGAVGGGASGA